jgi:elongation factor P
MIDYSDLKKGARIIQNNQPHEIIEAFPVFKGRGHSVLQVKLKNLINGNTSSQTFHPSDNFEEAELKKIKAKFLYSHNL